MLTLSCCVREIQICILAFVSRFSAKMSCFSAFLTRNSTILGHFGHLCSATHFFISRDCSISCRPLYMALLRCRWVGYAAAHIMGLRICLSCWRGSALNAVIKAAWLEGRLAAVRQQCGRLLVRQACVLAVIQLDRREGRSYSAEQVLIFCFSIWLCKACSGVLMVLSVVCQVL